MPSTVCDTQQSLADLLNISLGKCPSLSIYISLKKMFILMQSESVPFLELY